MWFEKIFMRNVWQMKKSLYLCNAFGEKGRLAQLVQSICLTSRGSGVRIPQRPQKEMTPLAFADGVFL